MASSSALENWPLRNDQIVLAMLGGRKTKEVAEEFGLSLGTISNIMAHPKAKEIIALARNKLREKLMEDMEDQLDLASKLSLKVIKRTLEADIAPVHKAKSNQDRVALKVLTGRGFLRAEDRSGDGGLQMTGEQHGRLMEGIEKAARVSNINPFEKPENEIVVEGAEEVETKEASVIPEDAISVGPKVVNG